MSSSTQTAGAGIPLTPPRSITASIHNQPLARSKTSLSSQNHDRVWYLIPANGPDEDGQRCELGFSLSPTPKSASSSFLARERRISLSSMEHDHGVFMANRQRVFIPEDETADGQTRLNGIQTFREASARLAELKTEMHKTVYEYFQHRFRVRLFELRAFAPMCKAITRLVATLDRLTESLVNRVYFKDIKDANYLMHELKSCLHYVLDQGEWILGTWNRRDIGQPIGEPLTGRNRTLRKIVIHESNDHLKNWTKTINYLEAEMVKKHAHREPSVEQHQLSKKKFLWLKYTSVTGKKYGEPEELVARLDQHPSLSMLSFD